MKLNISKDSAFHIILIILFIGLIINFATAEITLKNLILIFRISFILLCINLIIDNLKKVKL